MSGVAGSTICETFIEILGLKTLFSAFMGKARNDYPNMFYIYPSRPQTAKKHKSTANLPPSEDTAHILGIISSLFSNIASESPARIRLLAKFVESNYEKVDKLLEIRDGARTRLKATELEIEKEKQVCTIDLFDLRFVDRIIYRSLPTTKRMLRSWKPLGISGASTAAFLPCKLWTTF